MLWLPAVSDPSSDLFRVDDNGIVRLGRTPMESELNRRYTLNVTARRINENDDSVSNKDEDLASTLVCFSLFCFMAFQDFTGLIRINIIVNLFCRNLLSR